MSAFHSRNFSGTQAEAPPPGARPLAGRAAWLITDGKVGMDVQVIGVAKALGVQSVMKHVSPGPLWSRLAPWGPPDPKDAVGHESGPFAMPWPDIALATGRQSIPYIRAIKRRAPSTFTVIIQNPRTGTRTADLIAIPEHDDVSGGNVFVTLTAPNSFDQQWIESLRAAPPATIAALPSPRVAVMLGGPNTAYRFDGPSLERLKAALASLKRLGVSFLVTPSRRTPGPLLAAAVEATEGAPRIVWDGTGENPYPIFLALADTLVVTADSVNMTSEACATGRRVYVFEPAGGSAKFARFHKSLRHYGASRPLPATFDRLDDCRYTPLDSAALIAREIERRWNARR